MTLGEKLSGTARVLINKKTGDLMEGHRIYLFDRPAEYSIKPGSINVAAFTWDYDGWIVYHPQMLPYAIYFNKKCEEWFEDLGEL